MTKNKLLLGLAAGLILALVLFPSVFVATWACGRHGSFDLLSSTPIVCKWSAEFGRTLDPVGLLYPPWAPFGWWRRWGGSDWFHDTSAVAAAFSLLIGSMPALIALLPLGRIKPRDHGANDGLGTIRDLKRTGFIDTEPGYVVLGAANRKRVLYVHGDKHVLILAPSGGGKDTRHVVTSLLHDRGSIFAFDPKRELDEITSKQRRRYGDVHILDLADPRPGCASFNPFDAIREGFEIEDCHLMASLIAYQHGDEDAGGKAGPWPKAAAILGTAAFLQAHLSDDRTLAHVARWAQKVAQGNYPPANHEFVEEALKEHHALNNETRSSVDFSLSIALGFIRMGSSVEKITGESSFNPADLMCGDHPATLYLTVPPSHQKSLRGLQRLMLEMLVSPLKHHKHKAADGRPKKRPLALHAVEFTGPGYLDLFGVDMEILRGYGFRFVLSTQGAGQIYKIYTENNSIIENCQVIIAAPAFGEKTNAMLVKAAGKHWITTESQSRRAGIFQLPTKTVSRRQIDRLDIGEMQRRSGKESLVLAKGAPPVWLKEAPYYEHKAFRGMCVNPEGLELLRP